MDAINDWVIDRRVPPPPTLGSHSDALTIPPLPCPIEQAFVGMVVHLYFEHEHMREAANALGSLLQKEKQTCQTVTQHHTRLNEMTDHHDDAVDLVETC